MEESYKVEMFKEELSLIDNKELRKLVELSLKGAPDYFFEVPAASSGKYHPDFAQGLGGLVKHTKAVVEIAKTLLVMEQYSHIDKDEVFSAIILHDTLKKGVVEKKHTAFGHPLLASAHLYTTYYESMVVGKSIDNSFNDKIERICGMIASHMGQWNTSNYSDIILPKPSSEEEEFVHLCDYLGSRKFLDIEFDKDFNLM